MKDDPRDDSDNDARALAQFNALRSAIAGNYVEETKRFLAEFLSMMQEDEAQITPAMACTAVLGIAVECNAADTLKYLIEQGGDVNAHKKIAPENRSYRGSFLLEALYSQCEEAAIVLIEAGADLAVCDKDGSTPLHYAASYSSDPGVIALLLERGADMHVRNEAGLTPYGISANVRGARKIFDDYLRAEEEKKRQLAEREQAVVAKALAGARLESLKKQRPPSPFRKRN